MKPSVIFAEDELWFMTTSVCFVDANTDGSGETD